MKTKYHSYVTVSLLMLALFCSQWLVAQTADLRLQGQLNCQAQTMDVTIQIKAKDLVNFTIGSSSIFMSYNQLALSYDSYTAQNFGLTNLCIANVASPWEDHVVDGSTPGLLNLTMTLTSNQNSCPIVTNGDWITVGIVRFRVLQSTANPSIVFDTNNTNFNSSATNDGMNPITKGTFTGLAGSNLLACTTLPCTKPNLCIPATTVKIK